MADLLSSEDRGDLEYAKSLLENPSLAIRIANALGLPIKKIMEAFPRGVREIVDAATEKALRTALEVAISGMEDRRQRSADWIYKIVVGTTGAAGGAFGLPALIVELPVSTTVILRSIADIARGEGEQLRSVDSRLACLEVLALGGYARGDDAAESSYFATRIALAKAVAEAAEYIAERGVARESAPVFVRLVSQIGARFGIPVSEKVLAGSLPVVGAAGGALINSFFIAHFQDMAHGHFIVRRLERKYGVDAVQAEYLALEPRVKDRG